MTLTLLSQNLNMIDCLMFYAVSAMFLSDVTEATEPYPGLNAVVSTLSTGPVGPGDVVGGTNRTLLMR